MRPQDQSILFLDIDGVFNIPGVSAHDELEKGSVKLLNQLLQGYHTGKVKIVTNSAWNEYGISEIRAKFVAAGFRHPKQIVGQTDSTRGGGHPIRDYLIENGLVGTRYVIIDDSTHDYNEMWCRLVKVDPTEGFDRKDRNTVEEILWGDPKDQTERSRAVKHLITEARRLAWKTPWLTDDERSRYVQQTLDLIHRCLLAPNFLEAALLQAPTDPE